MTLLVCAMRGHQQQMAGLSASVMEACRQQHAYVNQYDCSIIVGWRLRNDAKADTIQSTAVPESATTITGAATPCLPTILAEGKLQTSLLLSITCISDNQWQGFRMRTAAGAAAQG
jgi:hypothetical protein